MQTVLITGGTGLVGSALARHLIRSGFHVIVFTRNSRKQDSRKGIEFAHWDPSKGVLDASAFSRADFIVNLAGAGVVDRKWTESYKKTIRESRVQACSLLVDALQKNEHKVKAVVSASAIGWYGADKVGASRPFQEEDAYSADFLGETCRDWEASIQPVSALGIRLVTLRLGIVLSKQGGALEAFMRPLRLGLAAVIGKGEQRLSWIGMHDLCRMICFCLFESEQSGVFNAVSPNPVSNRELNSVLGRVMRGSAFLLFPVPAFLIRLMLGARSVEVLKSTTVSAAKIQAAGFSFAYPKLEQALSAELSTASDAEQAA